MTLQSHCLPYTLAQDSTICTITPQKYTETKREHNNAIVSIGSAARLIARRI